MNQPGWWTPPGGGGYTGPTGPNPHAQPSNPWEGSSFDGADEFAQFMQPQQKLPEQLAHEQFIANWQAQMAAPPMQSRTFSDPGPMQVGFDSYPQAPMQVGFDSYPRAPQYSQPVQPQAPQNYYSQMGLFGGGGG